MKRRSRSRFRRYPQEPLLPSFLVTALNPTTEQLTSIFEISFSGANTQRFNQNDRMIQIQRGSTGFVSAVPTSQPTGNETGFQKDGNPVAPVFQPIPENHWGVWVNGWGDWVSVDNDNSINGRREFQLTSAIRGNSAAVITRRTGLPAR